MAITSKSTKTEIFEAYQILLAESQAKTVTMPAIRNTAKVVSAEALALAEDISRLGAWSRQRIMDLMKIYNQPILKTR